MRDRIAVPIGIDDLEVEDTTLVNGVIEVTVRSTFPRACWYCGSVDVVGHCQRRLKTARFAPVEFCAV